MQILPHIPIASRVMVEMEANLVAVARIKQYSDIALEVHCRFSTTLSIAFDFGIG